MEPSTPDYRKGDRSAIVILIAMPIHSSGVLLTRIHRSGGIFSCLGDRG
jgi:hypothetical protein